jgi:meso-butanediol dehydrogenase / (S,S)-butanediol dehydrogenase / diacetyl reductase
MAGRLEGKVALITGTSGGQGRAAAILFAKEGATVVGCGMNEEGNAETAKTIADAGFKMDTAKVDITDSEQCKAWIDKAAQTYGGVDIVYNNAARERFAPFAQMSAEDWHFTIRNELDAVFLPSRHAWSHLIARGGGVILNIASVSGMRGSEYIGSAAHAAGKSGVIGFTRQLALEGAPHNIRAISISPGPINTPVTLKQLDADPNFRTTYEGWTLLNRVGEPEDIAYAALYLVSDEASFVTGINLPVDGGWSAKGGMTPKE